MELNSTRANPYPTYKMLRDRGPILDAGKGNWITADYAICAQLLRDRRVGVRRKGDIAPRTGDVSPLDLSFLYRDPPDHTRLRRLVAPAFSPRMIAGYRANIESITARLLDQAAVTPSFDLVAAFATRLPIAVISNLLGIEGDHSERFAIHGAAVGTAIDGVQSVAHARKLSAATSDLNSLFATLLDRRRSDPGDDIISHLVAQLGSELTEYELVNACWLLLVAGFETTANLLGNAVIAFGPEQQQWKLLPEDGAAEQAVEEVLRFDSPVQRTTRIAHEDIEVAGKFIAKDDYISLLLGGANRDPKAFDNPDTFDITRPGRIDHLALSGGIHYCLGAPLAREEAAIALRMLAERMPSLRISGPVSRRKSTTIRGASKLPVTI